jgi:microcystin-dependent protein
MAQVFETGDAILPGFIVVMLRVPQSQQNWIYSSFLGMLYALGAATAWREVGETTSEEAAETFQAIFNEGIVPVISDVGDIKFSASTIPPVGNWLLCDGAQYENINFPDLFAVIGDTYNLPGDTTGFFRVPDLRGRVPAVVNSTTGRLPSFADVLGGTGGESAHTLTSGEMPSHTHLDLGHTHITGNSLPGLALAPGEEPVLVPNPIPGVTGSGNAAIQNTGGGGSHNNVQPTIALYAYILAGL